MPSSLQGQLFAALRRVRLIPEDADWQALHYSRCGRTDKGVSAVGQCVSLKMVVEPPGIVDRINQHLVAQVGQYPRATPVFHSWLLLSAASK